MTELLGQIEYWHWWVLGAVLVGIEIFAPSAVLLWPGIGAAIVGLVLFAVGEMGWHTQFALFAVFSVLSVLAWRVYRRRYPEVSEEPLLNRRAQHYVGRIFTLKEPIVDGQGKLNVDDTIWKITGEDVDAGSRVKVLAADGVILRVEQA